jgi:hypothetical protein
MQWKGRMALKHLGASFLMLFVTVLEQQCICPNCVDAAKRMVKAS